MTFKDYCIDLARDVPQTGAYDYPWQILPDIETIIHNLMRTFGEDYVIENDIAIHTTATVDPSATLLPPVIIGPKASVGPHALLRGVVYIGEGAHIGQGVEVKHSLIGCHTALAHFNYVGDSIIGSHVNLEAGAIVANHHNDREDKTIFVRWEDDVVKTEVTKFGACIGDGCKLGANAVTSPGTILPPRSIVRRLELIEQIPPDTKT